MPSKKQHGISSAANAAIGGIPTIYYFDFLSRGRGQVIRLLWEGASIAYVDIRYGFSEYWDEFKHSVIAEKNPMANVPIVEVEERC